MRESEARLILLPQPPAASSSACDVWFWSLSVLVAERNNNIRRGFQKLLPIAFLSFLDGLEPIQSRCEYHRY